ncbi:uncharacterized protein ARMOST_07574 [Armillaria ostoyae]|uniref:DUF6589 domain-containing protein n=1 Tax=Armillaria ostoyae TaxID=47428 RepID=A0A284R672_ARMOS|nr:uncharacterized protein ARMOST_07574 [Armillaria ostoyae]
MTKTRRRRSSLNPSALFSVSSSAASGSSVGTGSIFSFQGLSTPRTPSNLIPLSYEHDARSYISSSGSGPSGSLLFDASPLPIPHSSDFSQRLQLIEPPSPLSPVLPDILNTFDVETADICAPDYKYSQSMPPPAVLASPLPIALSLSDQQKVPVPTSYDIHWATPCNKDLANLPSAPESFANNATATASSPPNDVPPKIRRAPCRTNVEKTSLAKEYLSSISLNPVNFLKTLVTDEEFFSYQQGLYRVNSQLIPELLDALWDHDQIRLHMEAWMESKALDLVADKVYDEFEGAKSRFLMYSNQVTPEFATTWVFDEEMKKARIHMPKWNRILKAATESKIAAEKNCQRNPHLGCNIVTAQILHLRSQSCSKLQIILGLFASATGASHQMIEVLNHASLSVSYPTIQNIIHSLGNGAIAEATTISCKFHSNAYDNYNTMSSIFVEQTPNRMCKVQSGTFTVLYKLQGIKDPNHLLLDPILKCLKASRDVTLTEIRSSSDQMSSYLHQTQVTIVNILMKYVQNFSYLKSNTAIQYKPRRQLPSTPKTEFYPLRMATIEEATVEGNLHIHDDAYLNQMQCDPNSLNDTAILLYTDQLTLSRVRTCQLEQLGNLTAWARRDPFQTYVGKFHMNMNVSSMFNPTPIFKTPLQNNTLGFREAILLPIWLPFR